MDKDNFQKSFLILLAENQRAASERNTENNARHCHSPRNTVIKIEFAWNRELIDEMKARTKARWSAHINCWYIPKDQFVLGEFFTAMKPVAWIDYSAVKNTDLQLARI
jgi:hypothetical protein